MPLGINVPFVNITKSAGTGIPFIDFDSNNPKPAAKPASKPGPVASSSGGTAVPTSGQYSGGDGGAAARATAENNAYIDSQIANLNSLLGRTNTGLAQGVQQLNESYQGNVNQQNNKLAQAQQDYADNRVQTNKDKLGAYDTINRNANNGYRSLAQVIGRAAGTGSSAFQEALPDVVGKDTSAKRGTANQTYATNLGNIDTAQKKTELSFANILQDLANQRASQEQTLRSGIEGQRQNLLGQEQQLQAQRGNAAGAQTLQPQIEASRNAVESFFNQFKPTVTAQQAAIAAPDLSQYTVDRSNVNAQAAGAPDPTNPYSDILRKKLQDQAV